MSMTQANKQIVRDYIEAGNRGEWQSQLEMFDKPRFRLQCHAAAPLGYVMDYRELAKMFANIGDTMESFHITIDQMTAEDGRVAVQAHSDARSRDGNDYRNEYHFLFTIADGRITKIDEYLCSLTMAKVLDPMIWESAMTTKESS
jgi:ketosteroid isomerase-like protein